MRLFERLLGDLPFSSSELATLIRTAPHRYKVYGIPKRSSKGQRIIAQPSPEVKLLQRWVVENILTHYPIHSAAVAYRRGINIKDNARFHVGQRFLLKMDFSDFFPSITANDFSRHTSRHMPQYQEDLPILVNILFRKTKDSRLILSIGAPSSPMLSNSIVYDFDVAVASYVAPRGVVYTRYADDMIFSTNVGDTLQGVYKNVVDICRITAYPSLTVNLDKTVFTSKKWNRTVTGLVLSNESGISIGWQKKRALRSEVHRFLQGKLDVEQILRLKGYLAFVKDVEPQLFAKLRHKVPEYAQRVLFD